MTPIITTAMLSALACLRQRVSYVLMRGGDDAPLQLVADSVGDVVLTGPDGARTVIRPATYMILCQEDWEDHVQPVCDAVAHALTAG